MAKIIKQKPQDNIAMTPLFHEKCRDSNKLQYAIFLYLYYNAIYPCNMKKYRIKKTTNRLPANKTFSYISHAKGKILGKNGGKL